MRVEECDDQVLGLAMEYVGRLQLPTDSLWITSSRETYATWLNRRIPSAYGGAYCFLRRQKAHAVLINLPRIDMSQPKALEIVVAEELIHMRDHLDGDTRRHAHHGHDRIAVRVAEMTGASLDEVRSALIPTQRRPYKYLYQCPKCRRTVPRRKTGTWSCGACGKGFDRRYILRLVERLDISPSISGE